MTDKRPIEIRNDKEKRCLSIVWEDNSRREYPLDDLRNACPCAGCKGHSPGEVEPPTVSGALIQAIHEVGTYAVRFDWSDGHTTGIYTWPYLDSMGS